MLTYPKFGGKTSVSWFAVTDRLDGLPPPTLAGRCRNGHAKLLPAAECAIGQHQLGPQLVAAACGASVKHRVGHIGRRHIDLMAAGLRHAVDDEIATRHRSVGVPQLKPSGGRRGRGRRC